MQILPISKFSRTLSRLSQPTLRCDQVARSVEAANLHPFPSLGDPSHRVTGTTRHLRRLAGVVLRTRETILTHADKLTMLTVLTMLTILAMLTELTILTILAMMIKPERRETHEGKCLRCTWRPRIIQLLFVKYFGGRGSFKVFNVHFPELFNDLKFQSDSGCLSEAVLSHQREYPKSWR